ncbi:MAG TPA: hypothetical protein VGC19_05570 [Rhodanobacter sp.]
MSETGYRYQATFAQSEQRAKLFGALKLWAGNLEASGIAAKLWICGSFLTAKPEPKDIDVVLWPLHRVYAAHGMRTVTIVLDPKATLTDYTLDVHIEGLSNDIAFDREATHLGMYGFGWDRRMPKTIVEIMLNP